MVRPAEMTSTTACHLGRGVNPSGEALAASRPYPCSEHLPPLLAEARFVVEAAGVERDGVHLVDKARERGASICLAHRPLRLHALHDDLERCAPPRVEKFFAVPVCFLAFSLFFEDDVVGVAAQVHGELVSEAFAPGRLASSGHSDCRKTVEEHPHRRVDLSPISGDGRTEHGFRGRGCVWQHLNRLNLCSRRIGG
eukprot:scaffold123725_cov63-Phaeocystis_antarctica.AAC.6